MRKIINTILTIMMFVSILTINVGAVDYTNHSQKFSDVAPVHWAFQYIEEMSEKDIISGYPDGNYYPNNNVTRAEFAKIMASAAGLSILQPSKNDFTDVSTTAWYAPYIHAAYPYLSGSGNYYYPDTPAIREDIAVALVKLKGYDTSNADVSILTNRFTDSNTITWEAKNYVAVAVEKGLVSGYDDNTFRGQSSITRAEAAAMIWRALLNGNNSSNIIIKNTPTPTVTSTPIPNVTATPIPSATPMNEVKPTEKPIERPTETPEPIEEVKPEYSVDTICKVSNLENMTVANTGYIYYESNNMIYEVDIETGRKQEFFSADYEEMEYTDGTDVRSNFNIDLIFFNNESDRLYMCGHYTSKNYETSCNNCAIYDITSGSYDLVYFSENKVTENRSNYYFDCASVIDADTVYIYSTNGLSSTYPYINRGFINLDDGTCASVGQGFGSNPVFKKGGEYYFCSYDGITSIGSRNASKSDANKVASTSDKAPLFVEGLNNTQGFCEYNGAMYYFGSDSGDVYRLDTNGSLIQYISTWEVEQNGDNIVSNQRGDMEFFSMNYNELPIWYDSSLDIIKRYVRN